jgi:hypothetical protein
MKRRRIREHLLNEHAEIWRLMPVASVGLTLKFVDMVDSQGGSLGQVTNPIFDKMFFSFDEYPREPSPVLHKRSCQCEGPGF